MKKQSPSILMLISVYSPKGTYDANFLINYCGINLRDQLLRIPGIAQVDLFGGADYGMRIWLRPDKLAKLGLTPSDVISAIKEQNLQAPAGRIGAAPSPEGPGVHLHGERPGPARHAPRNSRTSSSARPRPARRSASGTSGAPSSARRTTTPSAGSTASPPARWPSTCCRAPTSSRPPRRSTRRMRRRRGCSRPTWTTRSSTTRRRR